MKHILYLLFSLTLAVVFYVPTYALSAQNWFSIENNSIYYDGNQSACSGQGSTQFTNTSSLAPNANVYILGDTISEYASTEIIGVFRAQHHQVNIDAQPELTLTNTGIGGTTTTGMDALTLDKPTIQAAGAIIVELGSFGGDTPQTIDAAIKAIRADNPSAPIYWVDTIVVNNPLYLPIIQQANQAIYSQAGPDNYTVVSWFKTVDPSGNPTQLTGQETDSNGYLLTDLAGQNGILPTTKGIQAFANLLDGTVTGGSNTTPLTTSCCPETTVLTGSSRAIQAYNFFIQNGFTSIEAAGIVGNMIYESEGVNPEQIESDGTSQTPPAYGGWGIVQFTPGTKAILIAQAANVTTPIYELSTQLQLVLDQLNGTAGNENETQAKTDLQAAANIPDATTIFMNDYENPYAPDAASSISTRIGDALKLAAAVQSGSSGSQPVSQTTSTASSPSSQCSSPGSTTTTSSTPPPANSSPTSAYVNPFRDVSGLTNSRIDQGVDLVGNGPVYALGSGKIVNIYQGWCTPKEGCDYSEPLIAYQLTTGPANGLEVYVAECITIPTGLSPGTPVDSNTVIADMMNSPQCSNGIETGWLNPNALPMSMAYACFKNSATAFGVNFSQLLQSLGSPEYGVLDPPVTCVLPAGWPTW